LVWISRRRFGGIPIGVLEQKEPEGFIDE
jgi:hypothetical protein